MNKQQEGDGYIISNEGYGLGEPIKPIVTAWAVEIDDEINPYDVVKTRRLARQDRRELQHIFSDSKVHVRRVQIVPVKGR